MTVPGDGTIPMWTPGHRPAGQLAKGLEYDHVIVVEPAEIVAAEPRGLNRLYVVLTRAVSRLAILHHRPLPPPLTPYHHGERSGRWRRSARLVAATAWFEL